MKKQLIALLLVLLFIPICAFCEGTPERISVHLVINGQTVDRTGSPAAEEETVGAYIINGVLYISAGVIPTGLGAEISFDEETNTLYVDYLPESETPQPQGHCWTLVDTVHDVEENEDDGPRTWLYEYKDISGGGRYVIDYTWDYKDEYAHYTAIGECSNPPDFVLPDQKLILTLKVYSENVVNSTAWGSMDIGYIQYDRADNHYANTTGFNNVIEGESANYNSADGPRTWQIWAEFPEGRPGETISFSMKFHRGDKHPVQTTWTYAWVD